MSIAQNVVARFKAAHTAGEVLPDPSDPAFPAAILAFNTELAKLCQRLKRDAGAKTIAQNYRGTGSQVFRRQLWVRFNSGAVIDLWLERAYIGFGGVVMNPPPGDKPRQLPKGVPYKGKTPEQVYAEVAKWLKDWASP